MIDFNVSKSRYIRAVQCLKMYWMDRVKPDEYDESVMDEAVLENGNEVGQLAQNLFDGISVVEYSSDKSQMITKTAEYIQNGSRYIAEASFAYMGRFLSVDILQIDEDGVVIYEVKSSTSVKDVYIDDVAYQSYVLSLLNYKVKKANVIILNSEYVRRGALEMNRLFSIYDETERAFSRHKSVEELLDFLSQDIDLNTEPDIDIAEYCFSPYPCGYFGYCTRHLPKENVFTLRNLNKNDKLRMYYSGIHSFFDVINEKTLYAKLRPVVKDQLQKKKIVKKNEIGRFIKNFYFPLYYLDFETVQYAIPPYDGMKPYQQMPFQYSLHIEHEDGTLEHKEYLANDGFDCREELALRLINDIPKHSCSIAYNMAFEKGIIADLAFQYPKYYTELMDIFNNMLDLMIPFKNHWYYDDAMAGSYSIKYVLPAMFPDDINMDYNNLEGIKRGDEAMAAFRNMPNMSEEEKQVVRNQLLEYCKLDTYAMVKIMKKLREEI
ncbi:MAG: hypothetical protein BWX97_00130 [Firmicutes bacterium ADurb.Bin146]|nr:MAG: hypothetical protein BWX97_00130 [Firmicutes bacterium ADurb.Bin146]